MLLWTFKMACQCFKPAWRKPSLGCCVFNCLLFSAWHPHGWRLWVLASWMHQWCNTDQSGQTSLGAFFCWCVVWDFHSLVCGMSASWKSGAWGQAKWLYESVIDCALSVANVIDRSCVKLMVKALSHSQALKWELLSALAGVGGGGQCPLPDPALAQYCKVLFCGFPEIPETEGCLERAKRSALLDVISKIRLPCCPENKTYPEHKP